MNSKGSKVILDRERGGDQTREEDRITKRDNTTESKPKEKKV